MNTTIQKNHVDVVRYFGNGATIGVFVFNRKAQCFTLEDQFRAEKLKGRTRIPAGLYELELKPKGSSRLDNRPWNMPPLLYHGMIRVKDVPGFEEILIHPGNTDTDTEGCLLVGLAADSGLSQIKGSIQAYIKIYQPIANLLKNGERVSIQFHDQDRLAPTQLIA